jgi:hypothetical protein
VLTEPRAQARGLMARGPRGRPPPWRNAFPARMGLVQRPNVVHIAPPALPPSKPSFMPPAAYLAGPQSGPQLLGQLVRPALILLAAAHAVVQRHHLPGAMNRASPNILTSYNTAITPATSATPGHPLFVLHAHRKPGDMLKKARHSLTHRNTPFTGGAGPACEPRQCCST